MHVCDVLYILDHNSMRVYVSGGAGEATYSSNVNHKAGLVFSDDILIEVEILIVCATNHLRLHAIVAGGLLLHHAALLCIREYFGLSFVGRLSSFRVSEVSL